MHSFVSCLMHVVFSTKDRRLWITGELQERLWPYLGGIARENKMKAIEVGGVADHVHILISLPSPLAIAKAVQLIKGNSSKWIHETFPAMKSFEWQEGYGAFTFAAKDLEPVRGYVLNQEEHHRVKTFQEEYVAILKLGMVEHDDRYLW